MKSSSDSLSVNKLLEHTAPEAAECCPSMANCFEYSDNMQPLFKVLQECYKQS